MKYLKLILENEFWKVRTDTPYFEISLEKIGMTKDEQEEYENLVISERYFNNRKYFYIGLKCEGIGSNYYYGFEKSDFKNYIYSGEIEKEITSEDIEKWKLKNDVNKYNL